MNIFRFPKISMNLPLNPEPRPIFWKAEPGHDLPVSTSQPLHAWWFVLQTYSEIKIKLELESIFEKKFATKYSLFAISAPLQYTLQTAIIKMLWSGPLSKVDNLFYDIWWNKWV